MGIESFNLDLINRAADTIIEIVKYEESTHSGGYANKSIMEKAELIKVLVNNLKEIRPANNH